MIYKLSVLCTWEYSSNLFYLHTIYPCFTHLQTTDLPLSTVEDLCCIVDIIFEKAVAEPIYSATYAMLCQRIYKVNILFIFYRCFALSELLAKPPPKYVYEIEFLVTLKKLFHVHAATIWFVARYHIIDHRATAQNQLSFFNVVSWSFMESDSQ